MNARFRSAVRSAIVIGVVAFATAAAVACAHKVTKPAPDQIGDTLPPATPPAEGDAGACGFGSTPTPFTLPLIVGVPASSFTGTSGTATCAGGGGMFHYVLRDMDGDQQPDLVVDSACDDSTIGANAWRVYHNTGTGFDPMFVRFAMPLPLLDPTCAKTDLADVNGDLKPDLVVVSLCTDASVGSTRWLVYLNVGTGFASPAAPFGLPNDVPPNSFTALSRDTAACTAGVGPPAYAFFDIDGDRRRDLVVTDTCNDTSVGTSAWRVHLGLASGAGVDSNVLLFSLPAAPVASLGAYASSTGRTAACSATSIVPTYSIFDFDGDFKPDLLVTHACSDTTVGASRWFLYPNSGTGFATQPVAVTLPVIGGAPIGSFPALSADPDCATSHPGYGMIDTTGDLKPDLLVTRACADPSVGATRWLQFRNGDAGLETTPETLGLPAPLGGTVANPLGLGGAESCAVPFRQGFYLAYLAKLQLHIVVTAVCGDSTVGTTRWLVYPSSCP